METFAVDGGFSQTKWFTGTKQGKFASAVAAPAEANSEFESSVKKYTIGKRTVVVGNDALKSGIKQDFSLEVSDLIEDIPFLVAKAADEAGIDLLYTDTLALGLPITDFQKNKVKLIEIMSDFVVNGVRYTPAVKIIPQGVGAIIAYARESAVAKQDDEGILIDLGGCTAIVVSHTSYKATAEGTKQYDKDGIAAAAKILSPKLADKFKTQFTVVKIMEIMRTGMVKYRGKDHDLREMIDEVLTEHVNLLIHQILTDYSRILDGKDHLLLAGGGAKLLQQYIPEEWASMIRVLEDPEWANVRGFFYDAKEG
jgi:hypothetical protein